MNEPTYNYTAFQDHFWHFYRDEDAAEGARAEAIKKEPAVICDRIRSNLIGGAAGDALGYPVEFFSWNTIVNKYGKYKVHGIVEYKLDPKTGLALFSDDTQMTLFTANGILVNETPKAFDGSEDKLKSCMYEAYLEWWRTQRNPFPHVYKWRSS